MGRQILYLAFIFMVSFTCAECLVGQVDINIASEIDLDKLTGVGPVTAQNIVATRPFLSLDDLLNVKGIGPATLEKIKQQGLACVSTSQTFEGSNDSQDTITPDLDSPSENFSQESKILEPLKIDLNTANLSELNKLSGVGPATAQLIIEARPFLSLDDLLNVKGIGPATLEKIKQQGLAYVEEKEQLESNETEQVVSSVKPDNLSSEFQSTENIIKLDKQEKVKDTITGSVIYESKTEKIRRYAIYAFSVILVGVLFLILKR